MGYTRHAIKGVSWIGAFRLSTRAMSFIRTIIVARILSPSQFGLYGIAALLLSMIEILTETGINIILVQTNEKIEEYLDTAWVVSLIRGFLISAIIFLSSFFVANFFHAPSAVSLIQLVSLVPLLRGFINPAVASFQKELRFDKYFFYSTSQFFVESIVTIIFILIFKSPIALIWGLVVGAAYEVAISFLFVRPLPKIHFHKEKLHHVVSRGKWVTLAGIFQYFFQNGDNIVVGRMLGTGALGIYEMAYKMATLPISEISDTIARVTFPVYVKIADDKRRLRRAFLRTTALVGLVSIPLGVVFLLFSKELVLFVLGPKWVVAAPVFQVLAIFGITQSILGNTGAVFLALKKQEYTTIITFVSIVFLSILIVPFTNMFGLVGAGVAVVTSSILTMPVLFYYLVKLLR
jgi:O-antigen/teichoic acid export membrane protein